MDMVSVEKLLSRANKLLFAKMWASHCVDFEATLRDMIEKISKDENSFIKAFQNCKDKNLRYVMRDVLYLRYETQVNSYKHLSWAPWMESKCLVSARNKTFEKKNNAKENAETTQALRIEYLDRDDLNIKALGKRDIFDTVDQYGSIHYGFLMILFTESMEMFEPERGIPFVKFMQARYNFCQLGYDEFKKKQEDELVVIKTFEELHKDCDEIMSKSEVRDIELQYIVERLERLRNKIDECIDYFEQTQSKVDFKNMKKIKELIDLHTKRVITSGPEKKVQKLTAKQIQKALGSVNKKGVFKPMDNERFKNLVAETKKIWNALEMRKNAIEQIITQKPKIHYEQIIVDTKGHFTKEFVEGDWLDKWNKKFHTSIQ